MQHILASKQNGRGEYMLKIATIPLQTCLAMSLNTIEKGRLKREQILLRFSGTLIIQVGSIFRHTIAFDIEDCYGN